MNMCFLSKLRKNMLCLFYIAYSTLTFRAVLSQYSQKLSIQVILIYQLSEHKMHP